MKKNILFTVILLGVITLPACSKKAQKALKEIVVGEPAIESSKSSIPPEDSSSQSSHEKDGSGSEEESSFSFPSDYGSEEESSSNQLLLRRNSYGARKPLPLIDTHTFVSPAEQ